MSRKLFNPFLILRIVSSIFANMSFHREKGVIPIVAVIVLY